VGDPPALTVQNVPKGRKLADEFSAARLASIASTLNFDDVAPAASIEMPPDATYDAEFSREDGFSMLIQTLKKDGDEYWIRATAGYFLATPVTPPAMIEAETLNAQWSPWVFRVAKFRGEELTRTLDSLLVPVEPAPGDPAPAGPTGG
jgi:hypothetical protein